MKKKLIASLLLIGTIFISSVPSTVKAAAVEQVQFKEDNTRQFFTLSSGFQDRYKNIASQNATVPLNVASDCALKDSMYSTVGLMNWDWVGYEHGASALCFYLDNPTVPCNYSYKNSGSSDVVAARQRYKQEQEQLRAEFSRDINYNYSNYLEATNTNFTVSNGRGYNDYYVDLAAMLKFNPRTKEIYKKNMQQLGSYINGNIPKGGCYYIEVSPDGPRMNVNDYNPTDNNEANTGIGDDWNHVVGVSNGDLFCRVWYDPKVNEYLADVEYYLLDVYEWPGNRSYAGVNETDLDHLNKVGLARDFGMIGTVHTFVVWNTDGSVNDDGLSRTLDVYKNGRNSNGWTEIANNL